MSFMLLGILNSQAAGGISVENIMFGQGDQANQFNGVQADSSGNIFAAGRNGIVIKMDQNGQLLWAKKLENVWWRDCKLDASGNLVVIGYDAGNLGVIAKYGPTGTLLLQKTIQYHALEEMTFGNTTSDIFVAGYNSSVSRNFVGKFATNLSSFTFTRYNNTNIGGLSSIAYYNNSIFMPGYYYSGQFRSTIVSFNDSGGTTNQKYTQGDNSGNTLAQIAGPLTATGQYLYQEVFGEVGGQSGQMIFAWNGSPGGAIQAKVLYKSGSTAFNAYTDLNDYYLVTSGQLVKFNSNTLAMQWERNQPLGFAATQGVDAANGKVYISGAKSGNEHVMKVPDDGSFEGTYVNDLGTSYAYTIPTNGTIVPDDIAFVSTDFGVSGTSSTVANGTYADTTPSYTLTITGA
jgi:hypothetical protein